MLMNAYYTEEAWKRVEETIRQDLAYLYEFHEAKGTSGKNLIEPLIGFRYISMLQQLPAERFAMLRDEYAYMVMQCSVHIFNRINKDEAAIVVENALLLATSTEVKESIAVKQAEMYNLANRGSGKRDNSTGGWAGRGIFFILFIIFKVATCNSNSNNSYNYDRFTPTYIDQSQLDSLQYKLQQMKVGDTLTIGNSSIISPRQTVAPPASLLSPAPKNTSKLDSILRKYKLKDTTPP